MARYIDADALLKQLSKKIPEPGKMRYMEGFNDAISRVRSMVSTAPTVDVVDVEEETRRRNLILDRENKETLRVLEAANKLNDRLMKERDEVCIKAYLLQKDVDRLLQKREANLNRDTALAVLKEFSRDMYPSYDIFGEPTLVMKRTDFEKIRHKYLDQEATDNE